MCGETCLVNGIRCKVGQEQYNSRPVSADGYKVGRIVRNKPCGCTVAWILENGNCPCAPKEFAPLTISQVTTTNSQE